MNTENTHLVTRLQDSVSKLNTEVIIKTEDNEIKIKNETCAKICLDKICSNSNNNELEYWIYFIFILLSVFILSVPFCLIAKYFIEKKRGG